MPMEPVTTNAPVVSAPAAPVAAPTVPTTPVSVGGPPPAVGTSGPPASVAPATPPAVTPAAPAPVVQESPELVQVRADRARLEAEIARLIPWAQRGYANRETPGAPTPATPTPAATTKQNILGVPDLDPNVAAYISVDGDGKAQELPGAPPGALGVYLAHQRAMGNALKKLASDPEGALAPFLEKMQLAAAEKAKKDVVAEQSEAQNRVVAAQIIQANENWMFEKDAAGQKVVVMDPLTGERHYKRTEGGDWWTHAAGQLMAAGVKDPVAVDLYARGFAFMQAFAKAQAAQPTGQPAPQPVPTAPNTSQQVPIPDLKTALLNRIPGALPGSHTPAPSNPAPAGRHLTLREAMLQGLTQAGYSPGSRLPMAHQNAA